MASFTAPVSTEWTDILAQKGENTFVILKIEKKSISVLSCGKGLSALKKILSDKESEESVLTIGFVVYGVDTRGGVTSKRQKAFRVDWMGTRVSPMKRGLQLKCKSHVSEYFTSCNITLQSSSIEDLDEKELTEQLLATGGAHKPKCYDFGDGAKSIEDILSSNIPTPAKITPANAEDVSAKLEGASLKSTSKASDTQADSTPPIKLSSNNDAQATKSTPEAAKSSSQKVLPPAFDASKSYAILLTSSYGSGGGGQAGKCKKLEDTFNALRINFLNIDGADAKNKDERNKLFEISGVRGNYPQVFLHEGEETSFVGDYEAVIDLVESNDIPEDILAANPGIKTFNQVFSRCRK